jgi:hypothetical protein
MNVRIIPEDEANDKYILKPLFEGMFKALGKRDARVKIHPPDPSGWEGVRQWKQIQQILDDFSEARLFVLCVDRDGHEQRKQILNDLAERANKKLHYPRRFFVAEHAWQEVEVWALAGIDWRLKPKWTWEAIRGERDSKEHYFDPIAKARGLLDRPGRGRRELGEEAARNYAKVRQNCPEVRELEDRIGRWIAAPSQR